MAKYNILDEDDLFSKPEREKSPEEEKESQDIQEEPEINIDGQQDFDDSLLEGNTPIESKATEELDDYFGSKESDTGINIDIADSDTPEGSHDDLKGYFKDEPEIQESQQYDDGVMDSSGPMDDQSEVRQIIEDYEDEKMEGINLKPFVWGAVIVIIVVGTIIGLKKWVFTGEGDRDATAELIEESQEPQLTPEQIQRNQYLAEIAGETNREIGYVSNVIGMTGNKVNLSSVLLYDKAFMFEVFSKDRADLAKLQRSIKSSLSAQNFSIVSSVTRPGSNGGVLGVYSVNIDGAASSKEATRQFASSQEAKTWISQISNSSGLKMVSIKDKPAGNRNSFNLYEVETIISGSLKNCQALLNQVGNAGTNIRIHKLNMTAVDQKSFTTSNFRMKLILQIYV